MNALVLLSLVLAADPSVRELNSAGMTKYKSRNYPAAIEEFRKAIAAGEAPGLPTVKERTEQRQQLALAHYNLACAQSLMRKANRVCEADAYRSSILENLLKSIELDPSRLQRALVDPDLQPIRDTVQYQSLLGLSTQREGDLPKILAKTKWWSAGQGVYGSIHQLTFNADGSVVRTSKAFSDDGKALAPKVTRGKWKLVGRALSVDIDGKTVNGSLGTDGSMLLEQDRYSDSPDECSA